MRKSLLLAALALLSSTSYAQIITGLGASSTANTAYTNGTPNDLIFIYCTPNAAGAAVTGTLSAVGSGGTAPYTFTWEIYNTATNSFGPFSTNTGANSTITGLASGGYSLTIRDATGALVGCDVAWVFVNPTTVDAGTLAPGCGGNLTLNGTVNPVANFTYYNPPPPSFIVGPTTSITVCVSATHTYVSDLGFYLIGPPSCGSPVVTLMPHPQLINAANGCCCNSGDNVNNLCFSTASATIMNPCAGAPSSLTGTIGGYGAPTSMINWTSLYGCDAAAGGWRVQIYDCIGSDVGALTNATIAFSGNTGCGPPNITYNSGAISSAINDNSCTAGTASIFTVPTPPAFTTPITLANTITSFLWTSSPAVAIPGASSSLNPTFPRPAVDTWFYLQATDNFGCTVIDSVFFDNNCVCNINNLTANISACDPTDGTYDVTGVIQFTNAPGTGTLIVETCGGNQTVFNPPFTSPLNYTISNVPADGTPGCDVTAYFSADPACTSTVGPYTEPICPCNIDNLNVNIGACDPVTDTYEVTVDIDYTSAPATGSLSVTVCGTTQTLPMPAASPQTFTFNLPSNGSNCNVTAVFTADAGCTAGLNYTAPTSCLCTADAGTFTSTLNGSGTTDFIMCFGDNVDIVNNGDFVPPQDVSLPGITYDPGLWLMVYSCPPTVMPPDELFDMAGAATDPCFLGIESTADGVWNIANTFGDGLTLYYVPITMYSMVDGYYSGTNSTVNCYDFGTPVPITFLPDIIANGIEDCADGEVTVTVSGGHPEIFGSQFTASNLVPASASFVNTTCGDGGTITISGLNGGENYSFDITDANGCPHTFSGGPFVGPVTANLTPAGPFCEEDPATNLTASIPGGTWTATCGACITAAGSFDPGTAGLGTHTVTYTPPGCANTSDMDITVGNIAILSIDTVRTLCFGSADGTITINAPAATQFSIDGGANFVATNVFTVAAGTYNIVIESPSGCQATGTATVTEPPMLTINVGTLQDETCAGACDGQVAALPAGGVSPYTVSWTGTSTGTGLSLTNVCSGTFTATVEDDNGCTASGSTNVVGAIAVTITSITPVNPLCNGGNNGTITVVASAGVTQYSIDNGVTFQATGNFTNVSAGTYNIVVEDAAGCQATGSVVVGEPTPVTVSSSADVTICIGQSTLISANGSGGTGPYNYQWDDPTNATTPTVNVTPAANTTYNVLVTDVNGCGNVPESVTVTLNPPLAVTALSDQSICPGASATIQANGSGGNGIYSYTWTNNITPGSPTGQTQTVSPAVTTVYTVTVTDGCGTPSATDQVTITVFGLPNFDYTIDTNQGCTPVIVNFTNNTAAGAGATCLWDFGDGTTSTNCNATHVFNTPGCYDIGLTMITADGCQIDTNVNNLVCVFSVPVADFTFTPQPADVYNPVITFTNTTIGGNTYTWDFDGLGTSTQTNPVFTFPNDSGSVYQVCLSTVSVDGCIDSTCHFVVIDDIFLLYVPNAFTPDGDGTNDIFLPVLQGEDPASYELFVFDRWGEVIFQSNNKRIGWDGNHKGIKAKEDVYVWKLRVRKTVNQEKVERYGHITLLR